jgi:hypothetical protein
MRRGNAQGRALAVFGALVIAGYASACSGTGGSDNGALSDDNGHGDDAAGGSGDGSSGSDDATGSSSGAGSSSGTGSSSGSSGSSSGASSGGAGHDAGHDGASMDATGPMDGSTPMDSGNVDDGGLTAEEHQWLDPMNAARAAVGEAPLTWNPIAAMVALNYANKCNYAHNPNRKTDYMALGGTGSVGENIAAGAPTLTIAAANKGWIDDERPYYNHTTNTCDNQSMPTVECGHYTQIVWKTTTAVGCAMVKCTMNTPFTGNVGTTWYYAVCDYTPAGNIVGQSPY